MSEMIVDVPLEEIFSDDMFNCRGPIIPFDVIELAKNVQMNGLMQPIVIQPWGKCPKPTQKYRIVMGHRRFMAFRVNKAATIPCIIKTGLTDDQAFTMNLVENIERKDLNILQEAKAIYKFKLWGYTQEKAGQAIGKSAGWARIRFMLLELPEEIQAEAGAGLLTTEQIKQIHSLPNRDRQFEAVRKIKDSKLRGEKIKIKEKPKRKTSPYAKKIRNEAELDEMLDIIYDGMGPNLATRALAWAAGNISDIEFYKTLKEHADSIGKHWSIPNYIVSQHINAEERMSASPQS